MYLYLIGYLAVLGYFIKNNFIFHKRVLVSGKDRTKAAVFLGILFVSIPLIYAFSMRDLSVGSDTNGVYYDIYYNGYVVNSWQETLYESLFIYFGRFVHKIYPTFRFFLGVSCAIICATFFSFFIKRKKEINVVVAFCLFFVLIYLPSYNILRQMLAVAVSFIGYLYLEKGRPAAACFVFLLASFLHVTAVVMFIYLITYKFSDNERAKRRLPYIFFCAPIIVVFSLQWLVKLPIFIKFQNQIDALFDWNTVNIKFFAIPLLILPLILLNWKKLILKNKYNYMHLCGYIFVFSTILMSGYLWYAFRMMYYFLPSYIILAAQLGNCCKKRIIKWFVNLYLMICSLFLFYFLYVYFEVDGLYPYISMRR